jgi:hypothetical protein
MKKWFVFLILVLWGFCMDARIKNPDKPLKGEWNFKLKKIWEVNMAGKEVIGQPRQVLVADNGYVIVYDNKFKINRIFTPDGEFLKSFGKRGEGPGEIKFQTWAYTINNKVFIPDGGKVHFYTHAGRYIKSLKKSFSLNPVLFIDENRLIAAPLNVFQLRGKKAKIIIYNLKTQKESLISEFSVFEGGVGQDGDQVVDIIMPGLSPLMVVGFDQKYLYHGLNNSYLIHITDLQGKKIGSFSVDREKRKVTMAEKKERFKNSRMSENMVQQIIKSLPDEISSFSRIGFHRGLIYVYVADLEHWKKGKQNPKQIDIFSREGKYLYRAKVKFENDAHVFYTPFSNLVIKNGFLYAALEDKDGEVNIGKYKISLPGEGS